MGEELKEVTEEEIPGLKEIEKEMYGKLLEDIRTGLPAHYALAKGLIEKIVVDHTKAKEHFEATAKKSYDLGHERGYELGTREEGEKLTQKYKKEMADLKKGYESRIEKLRAKLQEALKI